MRNQSTKRIIITERKNQTVLRSVSKTPSSTKNLKPAIYLNNKQILKNVTSKLYNSHNRSLSERKLSSSHQNCNSEKNLLKSMKFEIPAKYVSEVSPTLASDDYKDYIKSQTDHKDGGDYLQFLRQFVYLKPQPHKPGCFYTQRYKGPNHKFYFHFISEPSTWWDRFAKKFEDANQSKEQGIIFLHDMLEFIKLTFEKGQRSPYQKYLFSKQEVKDFILGRQYAQALQFLSDLINFEIQDNPQNEKFLGCIRNLSLISKKCGNIYYRVCSNIIQNQDSKIFTLVMDYYDKILYEDHTKLNSQIMSIFDFYYNGIKQFRKPKQYTRFLNIIIISLQSLFEKISSGAKFMLKFQIQSSSIEFFDKYASSLADKIEEKEFDAEFKLRLKLYFEQGKYDLLVQSYDILRKYMYINSSVTVDSIMQHMRSVIVLFTARLKEEQEFQRHVCEKSIIYDLVTDGFKSTNHGYNDNQLNEFCSLITYLLEEARWNKKIFHYLSKINYKQLMEIEHNKENNFLKQINDDFRVIHSIRRIYQVQIYAACA